MDPQKVEKFLREQQEREQFASGQVVSPARGLYTIPGHPCLAQYSSTADTLPATEAHNPSVPSVPSSPATLDSENDPGSDSQATPVPGVSTVPTRNYE